jgi:hypothetical protein
MKEEEERRGEERERLQHSPQDADERFEAGTGELKICRGPSVLRQQTVGG